MWLGSGFWLWAEMRYTTTQLGCKVHCKSYNPLSSSKSEFVLILEFIERRKERKRLREKPGSATSCMPHWGWSCNPSCICPDGTATVGCMGHCSVSWATLVRVICSLPVAALEVMSWRYQHPMKDNASILSHHLERSCLWELPDPNSPWHKQKILLFISSVK